MQSPGREPSMEDILASIKKVIAEEKDMRTSAPPPPAPQEPPAEDNDDEVLELDEPLAPPIDLGPPLIDEGIAETSRHSLETLSTVAASVPAAPPNWISELLGSASLISTLSVDGAAVLVPPIETVGVVIACPALGTAVISRSVPPWLAI